jgi:hypothetical protein
MTWDAVWGESKCAANTLEFYPSHVLSSIATHALRSAKGRSITTRDSCAQRSTRECKD